MPSPSRRTRPDGRRTAAAERRRQREQDILAATRALFDEVGFREIQIEDIARQVGTNRAIIYRHFTGKDELFALTLVSYLDELRVELAKANQAIIKKGSIKKNEARERLRAVVGAFADYGLAHPAFVDCAQMLMSRPGPDLLAEISEAALFTLGKAIAGCLASLVAIFSDAEAAGEFTVEDPDLLANHMYAAGLGALQLARVGLVIKEAAPGIPTIGEVSGQQVKAYLITSCLALIEAH